MSTALEDTELAAAIVAVIGDKSTDGLSPQGEAAVRLAMRVVRLEKDLALKEPPPEGWAIEGLTEQEADDFTEAIDSKPNIEAEPTAPRTSNVDLVSEGLAKAKQAVLEARNNPKDLDADF